MKYFSGFCLDNEHLFFKDILSEDVLKNQYTVCGFSFGAIGALEYTLSSQARIDRLILLSPSFFNNKDKKFKKLQLIHYGVNPDKYIETFLENIKKPTQNNNSTDIDNYLQKPSREDGLDALVEMLDYVWDIKDLEVISKKRILLEVYLGSKDTIIDTKEVKDFFMPYGDVYIINNASHILKT